MATLTQYPEIENRFSLDEVVGPEQIIPTVSLADWYAGESAWYRQVETDTAELVAAVLRQLEISCRFHKATTPGEVIERSPRYRRCNLEAIEIPVERRAKLAESLECDAADFLMTPTEASYLAAWAILQLAQQAHEFGARTPWEFEAMRRQAIEDGEVIDEFI